MSINKIKRYLGDIQRLTTLKAIKEGYCMDMLYHRVVIDDYWEDGEGGVWDKLHVCLTIGLEDRERAHSTYIFDSRGMDTPCEVVATELWDTLKTFKGLPLSLPRYVRPHKDYMYSYLS